MSDTSRYLVYYEAQARGVGGLNKSFKIQKGNGVGSFFGNFFRRLIPYIKTGAKALGSEFLNVGTNLLRDGLNNKDIKESMDTHLTNAGRNLGAKASTSMKTMLGMGYKKRKASGTRQSRAGKPRKRTTKRRAKKKKTPTRKRKKTVKKRDIFDF
jgi:hypothetical protein